MNYKKKHIQKKIVNLFYLRLLGKVLFFNSFPRTSFPKKILGELLLMKSFYLSMFKFFLVIVLLS